MLKKVTYLSCIIEALESLSGMGSLQEINDVIEKQNKLPSILTNNNWKDNVRATIQRHCSQTKSYNGAEDLFYSVYGLGEGFWGLKTFQPITENINPIEQRKINILLDDKQIDKTEKEMLIRARLGQGFFRDKILEKYQKCIITGMENPSLLIASHIKPWRLANNEERLSVENGILLSPLYDKLFDKGLLTFDKNMRVVLSDKLGNDKNKIVYDTTRIYIINPSIELSCNMEYHRDVIFQK